MAAAIETKVSPLEAYQALPEGAKYQLIEGKYKAGDLAFNKIESRLLNKVFEF